MFNDSMIKKLYPYSAIEEATRVPDGIFPVYMGSGKMVMSIDATGMQGLNHGVQNAFGCFSDAGDMYLVKNGMVGNVISESNTIPLGYFDYSITVDGEEYNSLTIVDKCSVWSRETQIDTPSVNTRFLCGWNLCVEIKSWIPYGSTSPVFEFTFRGYDSSNSPIVESRHVELEVRFNLLTRQGRLIYDKVSSDISGFQAEVQGHESYKVSCISSSNNGDKALFTDNALKIKFITDVFEKESRCAFIYSFEEGIVATDSTIETLWIKHCSDWMDNYSRHSRIENEDINETFLYNNSLYLLNAGYEADKGYPIGHPFHFPRCWKSSNFWDLHFTIDAIMRSGNKDNAQKVMQFLFNSMKTEGKPFPWMFIYDGTSTIEDIYDIAPLVISTHGMSAIRYFEYYKDANDLRNITFPILTACCDYAIAELMTKEGDRWIAGKAVSNDVVETVATEINHTYTCLWFVVLLKKASEYAKVLGLEYDKTYDEIVDNFYLEHDDNEYFHCRGESAASLVAGASWVPFMLYPTEAMPVIDFELFKKTREKYNFPDLYLQKQNSYQPWTECIQAQSDHRAGNPENAYVMFRRAMDHTFGVGFFSEIGPRQQTVGLPPYISAHSCYISTYIDMFVNVSIWDSSIKLFTLLPKSCIHKTYSVSNVQNANNIFLLKASYSRHNVFAEFKGMMKNCDISILGPVGIAPLDMRVFVNGKKVNHIIDAKTKIVKFIINEPVGCLIEIK